MEALTTLSGLTLLLAMCLDFPRHVAQGFLDELLREKSSSTISLELNPNQN
ncbi:MAG: hypothetical protein NZM06_05685 [Chloroherpetonaceae bacterium]|nr:hypothetical protein [Chloroherpetonaceae bacterium]MDW8436870.1 hypothetical protein [Chloroherpetonaceae bacterium]